MGIEDIAESLAISMDMFRGKWFWVIFALPVLLLIIRLIQLMV